MALQLDPMLFKALFAAIWSEFEHGDCNKSVGCAKAIQQRSVAEGTVPGKQRKDQELLLGAPEGEALAVKLRFNLLRLLRLR